MKLMTALPFCLCVACLSLHAREEMVSVTQEVNLADDSATSDKTDDAPTANPKEEKREAIRWLNAELKDRTHILALLKKVKDNKSADKVGASLLKAYGNKETKKTAMGDAEPPKRPTGPVMEECEKKFKAKFSKLDDGIANQLKRIEELELDSDDLKSGIEALPKFSASSGEE